MRYSGSKGLFNISVSVVGVCGDLSGHVTINDEPKHRFSAYESDVFTNYIARIKPRDTIDVVFTGCACFTSYSLNLTEVPS